jgi:hypothetical protein
MKKSFAIKQMNGVKPLAALLKIHRQAIYQWGENVPELNVYKLRELRPDLFPPPKQVPSEGADASPA